MSATSMANVALARNLAPAGSTRRAGTGGVARAAEGQYPPFTHTADSAFAEAMKTITTYIPTEVLTVYIAGAGIFFAADKADFKAWAFFVGCAVATPLVNVLVFLAKLRAANLPIPASLGGWPVWESIAATIACVVYAAAIAHSPMRSLGLSEVIAGFLVVVVAALLGLVSAAITPTAAEVPEPTPPGTDTSPPGTGEPSPGGAHG